MQKWGQKAESKRQKFRRREAKVGGDQPPKTTSYPYRRWLCSARHCTHTSTTFRAAPEIAPFVSALRLQPAAQACAQDSAQAMLKYDGANHFPIPHSLFPILMF
ncbi:MAG: hypothetical protein EA364_06250 [Balneolaceae bacterium]|nr:MAG: hypothetical protein EA364_06250 [Balneolaceae bacterium]